MWPWTEQQTMEMFGYLERYLDGHLDIEDQQIIETRSRIFKWKILIRIMTMMRNR